MSMIFPDKHTVKYNMRRDKRDIFFCFCTNTKILPSMWKLSLDKYFYFCASPFFFTRCDIGTQDTFHFQTSVYSHHFTKKYSFASSEPIRYSLSVVKVDSTFFCTSHSRFINRRPSNTLEHKTFFLSSATFPLWVYVLQLWVYTQICFHMQCSVGSWCRWDAYISSISRLA